MKIVSMVIAGVISTIFFSPHAQAVATSCYGDYCTGKDPHVTKCDTDATTIESSNIYLNGGRVYEQSGSGPRSGRRIEIKVGVLEIRHSSSCHAVWARLNTLQKTDINYIGVMNSTRFKVEKKISGNWAGSPARIFYSPMLYARHDNVIAHALSWSLLKGSSYDGTYWADVE